MNQHLLVFLLSLLFFGASPALACGGRIDRKVDRLRQHLSLTEAQMEQVTDIIAIAYDSHDCWSKTLIEERRNCYRSMRKDIGSQIKEGVLSEKQQEELELLRTKRKLQRESRLRDRR